MDTNALKIFQMNDCDWWIGESLEACVKDYQGNIDDDPEYTQDARELTDQELDSLMFYDADENERPSGVKRTFREQLALEVKCGGEFPRMFASSEV